MRKNLNRLGGCVLLSLFLMLASTACLPAQDNILKNKPIYVWDFSIRDGGFNDLTRSLTEEFEEALIKTGQVEILERRQYDRLFAQKMNEKGIMRLENISEAKIESLKSLEADAIVFGEIYDDVEAGKIKISVSFQDFNGSLLIRESVLMDRGKRMDAESRQQSMLELVQKIVPKGSSVGNSPQVFFEDFSSVPEGEIPKGWIGGDKLMVKQSDRIKYLSDFEPMGKHQISTRKIRIPDNFDFNYVLYFRGRTQISYIGSVKIHIERGGKVLMNNTEGSIGKNINNQTIIVSLQKRGTIFRLFIDGKQVALARYPDFTSPDSVTFEFHGMDGFQLERVSIEEVYE